MKKSIYYSVLGCMVAGMLLFSCSNEENNPVFPDIDEESIVNENGETPLDNDLKLTQSQLDVVNTSNDFALKMLQSLETKNVSGKSIVFSPLSVIYTLGMMAEGAYGNTLREITSTLGFSSFNTDRLRSFCQKFLQGIPEIDDQVCLEVANGLFYNSIYSITPDYAELLTTYYQAEVEALDFSNATALELMNAWSYEKTDGLIPQVIESIDAAAVAYYMNSVLLIAPWSAPFDSKATFPGDFTRDDKTVVQRPLMQHQKIEILYTACELFQMCSLPYGKGKYCMNIVLPTKDLTLHELLSSLTMDKIQYEAKNMTRDKKTYVLLPRFSTNTGVSLVSTLSDLGIKRAFTTSAELSGFNAVVKLDEVYQKTCINVYEAGTTAASVTVGGYGTWGSEPLNYFVANHPFLYFIQENSTGAILFMGIYSGD